MELFVYTPAIAVGIFALLFTVEKLFPLRESRTGLLARLIVNAAISGLTFLIAMTVVRPSAVFAQNWAAEQSFGLVQALPLPMWAQFAVAFLLLDLTFYYWHVLNHKVPFFWRFHNVHHIDPDLDVSTGFRFHFGEVFFSTVFRVAQVSLIGVPFAAFAAYELVFQVGTLFHHSNLRLPIRFERLLNKLMVTPRMHGIHHSQVRNETNSNYGVLFPWWDWLHKTICLNIPQSKIEIGIAGYASPAENKLWRAFILPFVRQRDYWRKPDGSAPQRDATRLEKNKRHLAE
jgi:sterol desaturase/sphingolipid hydroxylase (fatty acid hydroxylase superfamily)